MPEMRKLDKSNDTGLEEFCGKGYSKTYQTYWLRDSDQSFYLDTEIAMGTTRNASGLSLMPSCSAVKGKLKFYISWPNKIELATTAAFLMEIRFRCPGGT